VVSCCLCQYVCGCQQPRHNVPPMKHFLLCVSLATLDTIKACCQIPSRNLIPPLSIRPICKPYFLPVKKFIIKIYFKNPDVPFITSVVTSLVTSVVIAGIHLSHLPVRVSSYARSSFSVSQSQSRSVLQPVDQNRA